MLEVGKLSFNTLSGMESHRNSSANTREDEENRVSVNIMPTDMLVNSTATEEQDSVTEELSEHIQINKEDPKDNTTITSKTTTTERKRKRKENEDDTLDVLTGIFLPITYPLNKNMDKTVTVGVFKSLDFKPAVLVNHCGKTSMLLTVELWDAFTKYISIIEAYLHNNLTGRKTTIGFDNSNIEIDNIKHRGTQYVRFRDLTKHNKKIHLSFKEFLILSSLTPAITRYIHQLITYEPLITDYLFDCVEKNPTIQLIFGPVDHSIYNKLPHEVSSYRQIECFLKKIKSKANEEPDCLTNNNIMTNDIKPITEK